MLTPWWAVIQQSSPWFVQALVVSTAAALGIGLWFRRRDGSSWWRVALLVMALGVCVAYTLTPEGGVLRPWSFPMTARLVLADSLSASELFQVTQSSLHVWLFAPLGLAAWLQRPRGRRVAAITLAFGAPIGIEVLQWLLPALGRSSQMGDVVLNLEGVAVGLCVAVALGALRSALPSRDGRVVDLRESNPAVKSKSAS